METINGSQVSKRKNIYILICVRIQTIKNDINKEKKLEKNEKFKACPKLKLIHFLLHVLLNMLVLLYY